MQFYCFRLRLSISPTEVDLRNPRKDLRACKASWELSSFRAMIWCIMSRVERLQLWERDFFILQTLFEARVMTTSHIAALHFDGRAEAAKKRLQKLKAADLIAERKRRVNEPSVLFLAHKGISILKREGLLFQYPRLSASALNRRARVSDLTVGHELEVLNVKAALSSAIAKLPSFSLLEFTTWPTLNKFESICRGNQNSSTTRPDGFIRIQQNRANGIVSDQCLFLEMDQSTETQERLVLKCSSYTDYYRSGGFAVRNGAERSAYKQYPFRVIIILKNAERRNNTALNLLNLIPTIRTQIWLTTKDEILKNPLGRIWTRPIDHENALRGTTFDRELRPGKYRRQIERDEIIEQNISKNRLFCD